MIVTYGYFEKSKLPKFYGNVAKMMESVKDSILVNDGDINALYAMLKKQLEKDRPAKNSAHVELYRSNGRDSGAIYVYPDKYAENAFIRIMFLKVNNVLEYDEPTGRFSYVIDLFGKGGKQ